MRLARGLPICHCISWNSNVPNEFLMNNKRHSYHLENFSCFTARSEDKDQIYSFGLLSAGFASQEWVIWQGISEAGKGHGKAIVGQRKWSYPFIKNVLKYLSGGVWVPVCSLSDFPGSIQFRCSVMSNSLRPHGPQHTRCPCPSPTPRAYPNSSIESVMTSNHLILCLPLLLLSSISPSIRVFLSESALCIRWPKYWRFSFSISPSNEHPGLISFRMDSSDLLAVQGILKSLLQHHSSKASILRLSAFFIVQFSHPYVTTGKTIALTGWTFVGKVMSLLFNMLSRLVIAFLPRSKHILISWLQLPYAVILETKK